MCCTILENNNFIIDQIHALRLEALSRFPKSTNSAHSLVSISHGCERFGDAENHAHLLAAEIIAAHDFRIRCHQERVASWRKLHVQMPEFIKLHLLHKKMLNSLCSKFSSHIFLTEQENRMRKDLRSEELKHLHLIFKFSINKWSLDQRH